jgi:hypothetical protein
MKAGIAHHALLVFIPLECPAGDLGAGKGDASRHSNYNQSERQYQTEA